MKTTEPFKVTVWPEYGGTYVHKESLDVLLRICRFKWARRGVAA